MNNQKLTNEERQEMIELAQSICSEDEFYGYLDPEDGELVKKLAGIALAALTAEPVKVPDVLLPYPSNDKEEIAHNAGWNACRGEVLRLNAIDNTAQQYVALVKENKC